MKSYGVVESDNITYTNVDSSTWVVFSLQIITSYLLLNQNKTTITPKTIHGKQNLGMGLSSIKLPFIKNHNRIGWIQIKKIILDYVYQNSMILFSPTFRFDQKMKE